MRPSPITEEHHACRFLARHYAFLSLVIVAVAAVNLFFRLGRESVGEWDESLYATTAWEMTRSGSLIATTFDGVLDYYNTKPPLNVWLIAAGFSAWGVSLVSLRLPSACFGLLTVYVLQRWSKVTFGPVTALTASLVLATTFGFLHLHSARSGNPDALLTLVLLLVVVVESGAGDHPWRRAWLGPLLATAFLLKGMAVLQPLLLVLIMAVAWRRAAGRWRPLAIAAGLFVLPVSAWLVARWRLDQWRFIERLLTYDMVEASVTAVEGHAGGPLYYLDVLQRYHYDWLGAGMLVALVCGRSWAGWLRGLVASLTARDPTVVLLAAWAVVALLVPTAMQTRTLWYLNPFYPLFALLLGLVVRRSLAAVDHTGTWRGSLIAVCLGAAFVAAESKSLWRIYRVTNLDTSVQGLLLDHVGGSGASRVFRDRRVRSEAFVVRALRHAEFRIYDPALGKPSGSRRGDLLVTSGELSSADARLIGSADGHHVYRLER
jgi:4-amino-4-deoxy-L-arabinose transferase-like glycosyltransferase